TLRRVLADFGETFLLPLMQAGMLSFGVAILLSYWITRSVARPLAHIANAAGQVAAGDYAQRVPVQGVTEARVVAQAFNDMTAQVQATQKAQQDFLANVSHDLRTPLTSIQGYSQAIMDGVTDDPAHSASIINYEAARLTRLVQDLLDIARIQSGRMQMLRQAIALDGILRNVGESLNIKARDANITLHLDIQPLPRIAGDGDRLAQVFTNLVDNALKHTSEGGQVWLRAEPQAQGIMVTVQDTGEGIPKDDLARIFERFYQVDKSRQRGAQRIGTGLGLAIVNEIVRAHGGTVTVASQVGVGTAFQVWLPQLTADRSTVVFRRS
ncbi:MAG: sensor histidine kinase, partial [Anaerolineales bacterium]